MKREGVSGSCVYLMAEIETSYSWIWEVIYFLDYSVDLFHVTFIGLSCVEFPSMSLCMFPCILPLDFVFALTVSRSTVRI